MKSLNIFLAFLRVSLSFVLLLSFQQNTFAQKASSYRIAFYNLENLFHPSDDSTKNDGDFTPEGAYHWTDYKYKDKCNRMAKAILSIGQWEPPAIVGVCEIENTQVLEDLVATDVLRKFGYHIIHYESPDRRGIDVGFIYRKELFKPHYSKPINVKLDNDPNFKTRDILYVKGCFAKNRTDTLHIFINHWPSRYGGQAISEPKRIKASITLKHYTDSLFSLNTPANIIILGDFNDEWDNISLKDSLKAIKLSQMTNENQLINLMAEMPQSAGSHRYKGTWSYLDQIIVSANLLESGSMQVAGKNAQVNSAPFLLETNERYPGNVPYRTFIGRRYNGGFSDHLPVYIDLQIK